MNGFQSNQFSNILELFRHRGWISDFYRRLYGIDADERFMFEVFLGNGDKIDIETASDALCLIRYILEGKDEA